MRKETKRLLKRAYKAATKDEKSHLNSWFSWATLKAAASRSFPETRSSA